MSRARPRQQWSDAVSSASKRKSEDELTRATPIGLEAPNTGGSSSSGPSPGVIALVTMDDQEEEENWSNDVFDAMVDIKDSKADIEGNEHSETAAGRQKEIDKMMEFGLG